MKHLAMAVLGLVTSIGAAAAQDKPVDLKFSHWVPATHPIVKASEQWAESISEGFQRHDQHHDLSGPATRQRPSTITTWRATAIADIAYANPGYAPGRFPVIAGAELPFIWPMPRKAAQRSMSGTANTPPRRCPRCALPGLRARSRHLPLDQEEDRASGRRGWHRCGRRTRRSCASSMVPAEPMCRPRPWRRATSWKRTSPKRSRFPGDRSCCSGWTRSSNITSTPRSTPASRPG